MTRMEPVWPGPVLLGTGTGHDENSGEEDIGSTFYRRSAWLAHPFQFTS